jgi:ATP-dependent RNA helicase DeaD
MTETLNFDSFDLSPELREALQMMNFTEPTPIQAQAIPFGLQGRDILGSAQTGTGKTAAFCIPMIDYLIKNPTAHALVMLPTRELAMQVHDVARKMLGLGAKGQNGIKTALLIGGEPIGKQYSQLDRRPRLLVGTPGRINDHLRGNPDLVDRVSFVVLDEADRMLDMGFSVQIDSILSETALERQTLMFSATFPDSIVKFSRQYLQNPERISVGTQSKPGENIIQETVFINQEKKYDELTKQLAEREGSVIVFVRTQMNADKMTSKLLKDGHAVDALHGGLRQRQREKVTGSFRKGNIRVLVATDVAARGLDVPHIEHVINHDLPQVAEDYIHRIGRTARGGNKGHAISFVSPGERHLWRDIERMLDPNAGYESNLREGGGKKFGGKSGGGKSYGAKYFGGKPQGGAGRKPFGRSDRPARGDRKEGGWNPANDFDRADRSERTQAPRGGNDRFANDPDAYKRTNSADRKEGGFKKTFRKDGDFTRRSENGNNAEGRSYAPRQGGFNKPNYTKDGQRSYNKPNRDGASSDRPRSNYGDRPNRSEGGNSEGRSYAPREGGFKKPFNKDGAKRSEGGFKKPFSKDGAKRSNGPRDGAEKRISQKRPAAR